MGEKRLTERGIVISAADVSTYSHVKDNDSVRVHELQDGDIFTVKDLIFQLDNSLFYEIKERVVTEYIKEINEKLESIEYVRTGEYYTGKDLNEFLQQYLG